MLFGVFDGHGGDEVAKYVQANFKQVLLENESFKIEKYDQALKETFLKVDQMLKS